jgi:hypothetical protein
MTQLRERGDLDIRFVHNALAPARRRYYDLLVAPGTILFRVRRV